MADAQSLVAVADDLTGALEIGALLCRLGTPALVSVEMGSSGGADKPLVLDTETRHLNPSAAFERTMEVMTLLAPAVRSGRLFYKKTDSTLRGNIASEIAAMLSVFPPQPVVFTPAYPSMGRTVKNSTLYVDGVPVDQTVFASDPLNPIKQSRIDQLFESEPGLSCLSVPNAAELAKSLSICRTKTVIVCDASLNAELDELASAVAASPIASFAAGSLAFASSCLRSRYRLSASATALPAATRWLVLVGSLHERSRQQVEYARSRGLPVYSLASDSVEALQSAFAATEWCVLTTSAHRASAPNIPGEHLARVASQLLNAGVIDGLVVFGGDTALALMRALECKMIESRGEILDGVAASVLKGTQDIPLITKAGGFGPIDVIGKIQEAVSCLV